VDERNANMKMFYGVDRITDGNNEDLHGRNAELRGILKCLWNAAVRPVLHFGSSLNPIRWILRRTPELLLCSAIVWDGVDLRHAKALELTLGSTEEVSDIATVR
jgi:hypothetical protein